MSDTAEKLNDDCRYNTFLIRTMIPYLQTLADRERVNRWLARLQKCNRDIEEMRLRNDFLYYLALNLQNGELRPPFNEYPPVGPLHKIAQMLPGGDEAGLPGGEKWLQETEIAESSHVPLVYSRSPDGGSFLASQPIPRCGAFAYLAVVSRQEKGGPGGAGAS